MKRILCFGLIASMTLALFTGCNNTSSAVNNSETTTQETGGNDVVQGGYAYEQELNIIDDNYRNYYEIFVYSFYDSDGDGIGDINGRLQTLDVMVFGLCLLCHQLHITSMM